MPSGRHATFSKVAKGYFCLLVDDPQKFTLENAKVQSTTRVVQIENMSEGGGKGEAAYVVITVDLDSRVQYNQPIETEKGRERERAHARIADVTAP